MGLCPYWNRIGPKLAHSRPGAARPKSAIPAYRSVVYGQECPLCEGTKKTSTYAQTSNVLKPAGVALHRFPDLCVSALGTWVLRSSGHWMTPAYDPKAGVSYSTASAASTAFDEGGRPPNWPNLAIGGPTWPRGRVQTTF